jgi:hypothetical protein
MVGVCVWQHHWGAQHVLVRFASPHRVDRSHPFIRTWTNYILTSSIYPVFAGLSTRVSLLS